MVERLRDILDFRRPRDVKSIGSWHLSSKAFARFVSEQGECLEDGPPLNKRSVTGSYKPFKTRPTLFSGQDDPPSLGRSCSGGYNTEPLKTCWMDAKNPYFTPQVNLVRVLLGASSQDFESGYYVNKDGL